MQRKRNRKQIELDTIFPYDISDIILEMSSSIEHNEKMHRIRGDIWNACHFSVEPSWPFRVIQPIRTTYIPINEITDEIWSELYKSKIDEYRLRYINTGICAFLYSLKFPGIIQSSNHQLIFYDKYIPFIDQFVIRLNFKTGLLEQRNHDYDRWETL